MNETPAAATVKIYASWLYRGQLRRILRGSSLDFTEDRSVFKARFEATVTPEQYDILAEYWMRNPSVHLTEYVVQ
jgi:hypothetical protein